MHYTTNTIMVMVKAKFSIYQIQEKGMFRISLSFTKCLPQNFWKDSVPLNTPVTISEFVAIRIASLKCLSKPIPTNLP